MIKAKSFLAGESELSQAGKTDLYRPLEEKHENYIAAVRT